MPLTFPELVDGKATDEIFSFDVPVAADGFLVLEVSGTQSMFPVIYPNEVPPLEFSDVVGNRDRPLELISRAVS